MVFNLTRFGIITSEQVEDFHLASLSLLSETGVAIRHASARDMLVEVGCGSEDDFVTIPEDVVKACLKSSPSSFSLHYLDDSFEIKIGQSKSLFNPGSSAPNIRDGTSGKIRKGLKRDLCDIIRIVEGLSSLQAQSTALIPSDVPTSVSDLYRLYMVLSFSRKPIVTGAFGKEGLNHMARLLAVFRGDAAELAKRPLALFDCCPVSPLTWGDVATANLIDCAKQGLPAQIVPAPLIGATSPVTLQGTLIQLHAEVLAGVVISQTVKPGAPLVYGCAPGVLDMRYATPSFSAIESIMVALAVAEFGHFLGLPTQAYLGGSDSKVEDAQAGFEAGIGLILGAMAGIDVISGPGMLSALECQSLEKLVIDSEICDLAIQLLEGISEHPIADEIALISHVGPGGDFVGNKHTRKHLRLEHIFPSRVVDRTGHGSWADAGDKTSLDHAREEVERILEEYERPPACIEHQDELDEVLVDILSSYGLRGRDFLCQS